MKLKKIKSKSGIDDKSDGYLIDANEKVARAIVASLRIRSLVGLLVCLVGVVDLIDGLLRL